LQVTVCGSNNPYITPTAFIITFRNQATYNRTWEARQIWGATMSATRSWALMCSDFLNNKDKSREPIYRHFVWITALRYQLRVPRSWENLNKGYNREYQRYYSIPETETPLELELIKYISRNDPKII
jgi:putative membrane protein